MNCAVRPIFNESFVEKKDLIYRFCEQCTWPTRKAKKASTHSQKKKKEKRKKEKKKKATLKRRCAGKLAQSKLSLSVHLE